MPADDIKANLPQELRRNAENAAESIRQSLPALQPKPESLSRAAYKKLLHD